MWMLLTLSTTDEYKQGVVDEANRKFDDADRIDGEQVTFSEERLTLEQMKAAQLPAPVWVNLAHLRSIVLLPERAIFRIVDIPMATVVPSELAALKQYLEEHAYQAAGSLPML